MVEPFIAGYAAGETPNPCVGCNGHVRLDAMLERGRPARLRSSCHRPLRPLPTDSGGPLLRTAADPAKDQTYMLAALAPESLARMHFPLGELTKPQVRELAARAGLPVAGKADSQDLCFLAGTDRGRFLARHGSLRDRPGRDRRRRRSRPRGPPRPAPVHGRSAPRPGGGDGEPLFVLDKDAGTNRVVVGPRAALQTSRVALRGARLHRAGATVDRVKLRYRATPLAAPHRRRSAGRPPRPACA